MTHKPDSEAGFSSFLSKRKAFEPDRAHFVPADMTGKTKTGGPFRGRPALSVHVQSNDLVKMVSLSSRDSTVSKPRMRSSSSTWGLSAGVVYFAAAP